MRPLKRVTVSSVGAEWDEGTGTGYAIEPGGVTFRHRRHPDLPWSLSGGDICHVVLGNGGTIWRMAEASQPDRDGWQQVPVDRTGRSPPAWLESAMGFLPSTTPARNGHGTARRSRSGFSPIVSSTAASRTVRVRPTSRSSSDQRIAGLPKLRPGCASSPVPRCCPRARLSYRGSRPRDAGPAGTLGFFATLDGTPAASRADSARRHSGRTSRDASSRPEDFHTVGPQAGGASRRRGGQPRSGGDGIDPRFDAECPPAFPSSSRSRQPMARAPVLPRVGGVDVAIIDELDKVNPVDRRADSRPVRGIPGSQSSLGCRRFARSSFRPPGTSSSRFRSCCEVIPCRTDQARADL